MLIGIFCLRADPLNLIPTIFAGSYHKGVQNKIRKFVWALKFYALNRKLFLKVVRWYIYICVWEKRRSVWVLKFQVVSSRRVHSLLLWIERSLPRIWSALNPVKASACRKEEEQMRLSFSLDASILTIFLLLLECPISGAGTRGDYWQRKRMDITPVMVTQLRFYFHDTVSRGEPTAVGTASAPAAARTPTTFGVPMTLRYPLTAGPEPTSKVIGGFQGMDGTAEQTEVGQRTAFIYSFTDGEFGGSTLNLLGRNSSFRGMGEMAVVGGTGAFRFARGYALTEIRWSNPAGDAVVEYNVIVVHR